MGPYLRKSRGLRHCLGANAVEFGVKGVKPLFGVNILGPAFDPAIRIDAGKPNLTDARDIAAGRLDIKRDKAKLAFGQR